MHTINFNMKRFSFYIFATILSTTLFFSCNKDEGINIFSIQDDKDLGMQTAAQIAADPAQFPILDPVANAAAYNYLYAMRDEILASGQVTHKNDFNWELHIIKDDTTQNAFCTPGGYIYIYTGLIKYLDNASSLAGVMGHEMAHADKRHSTEAMTKQYGISTLLTVLLGENPGLLAQISASLISLKFSRVNESEADKYSSIYLCPTKFRAAGAADFFEKIIAMGSSNPPQFLSTHPNPDNRVEAIKNEANSLSCSGGNINNSEEITNYTAFKASLP
jgi:predicted Zn-dependent protease